MFSCSVRPLERDSLVFRKELSKFLLCSLERHFCTAGPGWIWGTDGGHCQEVRDVRHPLAELRSEGAPPEVVDSKRREWVKRCKSWLRKDGEPLSKARKTFRKKAKELGYSLDNAMRCVGFGLAHYSVPAQQNMRGDPEHWPQLVMAQDRIVSVRALLPISVEARRLGALLLRVRFA